MAFESVRLCDIHSNPFRNMERYPIDKEKVDELKESIRTTGFWDNVVCRRVDGKVEQAYGHHRMVAAREVLGEKARIEVPMKDLDDEAMLKIMARENSETWRGSPIINMETVRAVVTAYAAGKIVLGKVGKDTSKNKIRNAPGFIAGSDGPQVPEDRPYTAESLVPILGWPIHKVWDVLNQLESDERDTVSEETLRGMGLEQAKAVVAEASKTYRAVKNEGAVAGKDKAEVEVEARAAARSVGKEIATKLKTGKISTGKVAETGTTARRKFVREKPNDPRPLPDIDEKALEVADYLDGILSTTENWGKIMEEITKYEEHMVAPARRILVKALMNLEHRVERLIGKLELVKKLR